MKTIVSALALAAASTAAFGATATLNCTPVNGVNTSIVVNSLFFNQGSGSGSFVCSDSALGALTLNSISVSLFTDYTDGNGNANDPNDNSAGFTFQNSTTGWDFAHPGAFTSTMKLGAGVTVFAIGNLSSTANTFTNTTSGGLGGTNYILPTTNPVTGSLLDSLTINATGFVDAGGFTSGASDARVTVTYSYTPITTSTPEPVSTILVGAGLLAVSLLSRKKLRRS
jgi:hypothetical protein